jgi:hypothetical protein
MLGILCTSHFIQINPAGRFPCALCLQILGLYLNLLEVLCYSPEFRGQVDSHDRAGVIATAAFDAFNGTLDSIVKLLYFSDCKSTLCREIAKEQLQTNYNFIYLRGGGLRPLKHEVFSAHRVFRHAGMDITLSYSTNVIAESA